MKKVKGIIIPILIAIIGISIMPFSVYADTISQSNIRGVNFSCIDVTPIDGTQTVINGSTYERAIFTFEFEAVLDDDYLGYVTGTFNGSYYAYDALGNRTLFTVDSGSRSFYVSGGSFKYYVQTRQSIWVSLSTNSNDVYGGSFTYSGSNVQKASSFRTLQDIESHLDHIYRECEDISSFLYDSTNGSVLDQLVDLNDMMLQAGQMMFSLYNAQYDTLITLERIETLLNDYRFYNIPFESYPFVAQLIDSQDVFNYLNFDSINYTFPIFKVTKNNGELFYYYVNKNKGDYIYVTYFKSYKDSNNNTYSFGYNNNVSLMQNTSMNFFHTNFGYGNYMELVQQKYYINSNGYFVLYLSTNDVEILFSPVFIGYGIEENISTDFALQFNYNNRLLNYLSQLANGTVDSNEAADDLNDLTSDFTTTSNDVIGVEDTIGTGFTNALQDVPSHFDFLTNFGASFISSAQWVRDQYNTMTVGNPFGSLITFSLILGIGLLLLGRKLL